jgi:serine/threonine protein kinase
MYAIKKKFKKNQLSFLEFKNQSKQTKNQANSSKRRKCDNNVNPDVTSKKKQKKIGSKTIKSKYSSKRKDRLKKTRGTQKKRIQNVENVKAHLNMSIDLQMNKKLNDLKPLYNEKHLANKYQSSKMRSKSLVNIEKDTSWKKDKIPSVNRLLKKKVSKKGETKRELKSQTRKLQRNLFDKQKCLDLKENPKLAKIKKKSVLKKKFNLHKQVNNKNKIQNNILKQKIKKKRFLEVVNKPPKLEFTFNQNLKDIANKSTNLNNRESSSEEENQKMNIKDLDDSLIIKLQNQFNLFLKKHVKIDLHFEYIKNEISEYFEDTNPEAWNLGFETMAIFYERKEDLGIVKDRHRYLVKQILTGQDFIIENIKKSRVISADMRKEVNILMALKNDEFVFPFYEMFEDSKNYYLVFEPIQELDLHSFIMKQLNRKGVCKKQIALLLVHKLLKAIEYIHSCGIVKRNISFQNIYVNENFMLRMHDFSNSSIVFQHNKIDKIIPTEMPFLAPELLKNPSLSNYNSDIWSCGKIMKKIFEMVDIDDKEVNQLIQKMTASNPEKRIRIGECLNDPIFNQLKNQIQTKNKNALFSNNLVDNSKHYNFLSKPEYGSETPNQKNEIIELQNGGINLFKLDSNKNQSQFEFKNNKISNEYSKIKSLTDNKDLSTLKIQTEFKNELLKSFILRYLENCGFPFEFLHEIFLSGDSRIFSHVGACYKILIKTIDWN